MSGDIFFCCHNQGVWGSMLLASHGYRPGMLLNIPQSIKQPPAQSHPGPNIKMPRFRNHGLKGVYFVCNLLFLATKGEKCITLTSLRNTIPWMYALGHPPNSPSRNTFLSRSAFLSGQRELTWVAAAEYPALYLHLESIYLTESLRQVNFQMKVSWKRLSFLPFENPTKICKEATLFQGHSTQTLQFIWFSFFILKACLGIINPIWSLGLSRLSEWLVFDLMAVSHTFSSKI